MNYVESRLYINRALIVANWHCHQSWLLPKSKPAGSRSSAVTDFYLENARFHVLIG